MSELTPADLPGRCQVWGLSQVCPSPIPYEASAHFLQEMRQMPVGTGACLGEEGFLGVLLEGLQTPFQRETETGWGVSG